MDVLADIVVRDRAVLVGDALVVADLHLGRGAASPVEAPLPDGADVVERLMVLCRHFDPAELVIAGDLLHSFDTVPHLVENTLEGILEVAEEMETSLVVTPGNHDTMLDVLWDGETTPEYALDGTVVCHGHVEPATEADRYVIGHDHPAITIEGKKRACVLAGDEVYKEADVVMLPAFNRLVEGVTIDDLRASEFMSPLVRDIDALAPVVQSDPTGEALVFPPLGEFRHRL